MRVVKEGIAKSEQAMLALQKNLAATEQALALAREATAQVRALAPNSESLRKAEQYCEQLTNGVQITRAAITDTQMLIANAKAAEAKISAIQASGNSGYELLATGLGIFLPTAGAALIAIRRANTARAEATAETERADANATAARLAAAHADAMEQLVPNAATSAAVIAAKDNAKQSQVAADVFDILAELRGKKA